MSTSLLSSAQPSSSILAASPDERSPLLPHDADDSPLNPSLTRDVPAKVSWIPPQHVPSTVVILCTLCILFIDTGVFMQMAPLTRILESIVCNTYYRRQPETDLPNGYGSFNSSIPEHLCKVTPVQIGSTVENEGLKCLAYERVDVLLAVPYGFVADKFGRKPVLLLGIVGVILSDIWVMAVCFFPDVFMVRLIWLAPLFTGIGGGAGVATSIVFTTVADVVSESQRSIVFFRITAAVLMAQIIAIPISSMMMVYGIWLPMFVGLGAMALGGFVLLPLPETLRNIDNPLLAPRSDSRDHEQEGDPGREAISEKIARSFGLIIAETKLVFAVPAAATLVFTFLVNSLGRSAVELLLQYASKRYNWPIAQASFLLPLRAAIQLALLLVLLPVLSHCLATRFSMEGKIRDLYISRISVAMLMVGSVGIGLSPNPILMAICLVIYALGSGFAVAVRSLATSLVEQHQVGRLYAAMTTMEMIGGMAAGPTLSALYGVGLRLGGPWIGLPFVVSGALFLTVALPIWILRLRPKELGPGS